MDQFQGVLCLLLQQVTGGLPWARWATIELVSAREVEFCAGIDCWAGTYGRNVVVIWVNTHRGVVNQLTALG